MKLKTSIYLDHAATTPTDVLVLQKMWPYFGAEYANPSSVYSSGRKSALVIKNARKLVAEIIGAKSEEIIFTGSGTESANLAILGVARANRMHGNHILVSAVEHKAVLESAKQLQKEGFLVDLIPVDKFGLVDAKACLKLVTDKTILISVMYANNEIGTIEPIEELSELIRKYKGDKTFPVIHTDACQAVGFLPLEVNILGVDLMTFNGSKIYGPKGIGVLYKKADLKIEPMIWGGGQEFGIRSGTESLPLIVGFCEALVLAEKNRVSEVARLILLRDYLIKNLRAIIPDVVLNGHPINRLPNNIHISIPTIEGESIILMLDELGIQASTGSACSSHDLQVSHVLVAIGQAVELMHGSVRFSLGKETKQKDLDYLLTVLPNIVQQLKNISSLTINL